MTYYEAQRNVALATMKNDSDIYFTVPYDVHTLSLHTPKTMYGVMHMHIMLVQYGTVRLFRTLVETIQYSTSPVL